MSIPSFSFHPAQTDREALDQAAELWGIEPDYWDIWGRRHITPPEVQRAILQSLGVACESKESLNQAVEQRLWCEWSRLLPPTLVVSENVQPRQFPLSIPGRLGLQSASVQIRWEDGSSAQYEFSLGALEAKATAELRGQWFLRKQAPLPQKLPLGYHDVQVSVRSDRRTPLSGTMRLIVGPDRAWLPRQLAEGGRTAGIAISLFGVRSARNWGCGDFTDLERIIDWASEDLRVSFVGLNPLHAIHNRQPFNTSPYLPNCIFYRNPIYIDVERMTDFQSSRPARELFATVEVQAELEALRRAPLVEYERVHALKQRFLKLAFDTFDAESSAGSPRAEAFREYCEREGQLLERYATYCALDEWIHGRCPEVWVWPDWPEEYRDPDSTATRRFAEKHRRCVTFHQYAQWQLDLQLEEAREYARRKALSIGLYHDLALATDHCGSDLWAHRSFFAAGCWVGSPPDDFSPKGQDWGFPPPNAERHRETGYRLFAESIRQNCRHAGALRIDHVMRFFRLYWIPEGMEAARGAYVRDFCEDLLRIVALESIRQKVLIVGEDLGTVEPGVRDVLARFGILSYRLMYFEKNQQGQFRLPHEYPHHALVSVTTHDLPTLAGFWLNRDIEARQGASLLDDEASQLQTAERASEKQKLLELLLRLGFLPERFPRDAGELPELTGELHNAFVGFLASTPSMLMALSQEDLLKETEQQNLPGTTWQYPNWRRKMRFSVEELRSEKLPRDFAAMFRSWLERTGRGGV
jgi:4-alpha-glucanotransferase